MNPLNQADSISSGEDYLLTLYEVCEILGKSTRTITRYVHKHILHPRGVKSRQGTLEYRFSRAEIDAFKKRQDSIRPYVYLEDKAEADPAPVANFADYGYPPASVQKPFLIPGISFPVQESSPASKLPAPAVVDKIKPRSEKIAAEALSKEAKNIIENEDHGDKPIHQKNTDTILPQSRNDGEIILLLKETTGMLRDQLKVKDDQIRNLDDKVGQLIERNRETNILLKGLQDKIMLLEKPSQKNSKDTGAAEDRSGSSQESQSIREFDNHEPLKEDRGAVSPIRIRVFPDTPANVSEKEVKLGAVEPMPSNIVAPRPSPAKASLPQKKGLFRRLFE